MKDRVFIIHGWGGTPGANWFPWLKDELQKQGVEVSVPEMPDMELPKKDQWIPYMRKTIGKPTEKTYLVGHSLGSIAILRYLESLDEGEKIGGAILVAAFAESINIPEIDSFFDKALDWERIKKSAGKFVVINSDNDHYVPVKLGEMISHNLSGEFILLSEAGHIQAPYGKFELPIALEKLKEMMK